jgi:4-hydroxy-tetrahydrodipicolinate reductase
MVETAGAVRVGVIGCAGRMGRTNLQEILATPGAELAGGVERPGHQAVGQDLGVLIGQEPIGRVVGDDVGALAAASQVVVEFSTPEATLANAERCARLGCAHVIGTTGLDAEQARRLRECAAGVPIVWAPNMSVGVNLLLGLVEQVARTLDPAFDIEILEMHHRQKVDAPSGTALALGRAAARGRGVELGEVAVRSRDGITGARAAGTIGFATLRGGDVVGDHRVLFAGPGERIELAHIASDRRIYSRGAVRAALWAASQPPGLYGMSEVLGLRRSRPD